MLLQSSRNQQFCSTSIGDEDVDPFAREGCQYCGDLRAATGDSDDPRCGLQCGKVDTNDAFHERRLDKSAVLVNELEADVSNCACAAQLPPFLDRKDIPTTCQKS